MKSIYGFLPYLVFTLVMFIVTIALRRDFMAFCFGFLLIALVLTAGATLVIEEYSKRKSYRDTQLKSLDRFRNRRN